MSPSAGRPSALRETVRVLTLMASTVVAGAVLATLISAGAAIGGGGTGAGAAGFVVAGGMVGYVLNVIVVPLMWQRSFRRAWAWLYVPPAVFALVPGMWCPLELVAFAVVAWIVVACLVLHVRLPPTWFVPRAGHCAHCDYSLRGIEGGRCPECGTRNAT
ncbi:MAG: hypothetical protein ACYTGP_02910 [Planctomycetota bacterium]|jgi:hypothetical protein